MKNSKTVIEGFKAVEFMRKTRDEISKDIATMNFEELKMYFEGGGKKITRKKMKMR